MSFIEKKRVVILMLSLRLANPYDRRYCEAFSDAEKYQIYKFEKVDTKELDDLNETGLEKN